MLRNRQPAKLSTCGAPLDKWLALGDKLGVRATPVSYAGNGMRVVGARFEDLQRARGSLGLSVVDDATGEPLTANVSVRPATGSTR